MNEKELDKLNQQDRIELKLDLLKREDTFNFMTYNTWFFILMGLFLMVIFNQIEAYSTTLIVAKIMIIWIIINSLLKYIAYFITGRKAKERYFNIEIKPRGKK